MRGKRSNKYRKLMHTHAIHFGFREPYQCLLDAPILLDAARFKMNFTGMLSKTLHGQIKPMITTCSMRHLYASKDPNKDTVVEAAKNFERRRCNHHELDEPLNDYECMMSVVDPKESSTNKFRYVVCTQNEALRTKLRSIPGVPMIYLKRSVMIMEPMGRATERATNSGERGKLRSGLRDTTAQDSAKRKRSEDDLEDQLLEQNDASDSENGDVQEARREAAHELTGAKEPPRKKKKKGGPKGANPLSALKSKKKIEGRMRASKGAG